MNTKNKSHFEAVVNMNFPGWIPFFIIILVFLLYRIYLYKLKITHLDDRFSETVQYWIPLKAVITKIDFEKYSINRATTSHHVSLTYNFELSKVEYISTRTCLHHFMYGEHQKNFLSISKNDLELAKGTFYEQASILIRVNPESPDQTVLFHWKTAREDSISSRDMRRFIDECKA
jgi:hypothetical protein